MDIETGERKTETYPTMAIPLFAECYRRLDTKMLDDLLNKLEQSGILDYPFGIPAGY